MCASPSQVLSRCDNAKQRFDEVMSYVMLQPCMKNKNEDKVVLVGLKPFYIADKNINPRRGHRTADVDELFEFAVRAAKLLKQRNPNFLSDGLVRVDIFRNSNGHLVVNEIESLEANYSKQPLELEMQVTVALAAYWENILHRCVVTYMNKRIKKALGYEGKK